MLQLLNRHALELRHTVGVDVDFDTLLLLNVRPAPLEFLLHVAPHSTRLVVELVHLDLR